MTGSGYAWRKYDCGVPLFRFQGPAAPALLARDQLVLWCASDEGQHPHLNRWEGLGKAFVGFVSKGLLPPTACAYDARSALEILFSEVLARTWIPGADEVQAYEYLVQHLLGVWMGEKTPFLVTPTSVLEDILKKPL